jgi:Fe-Mn family superoxide dismutase
MQAFLRGGVMANRREFLALSAAVPFLRPTGATAAGEEGSALVTGKVKSLKYEELKGFLSKDQLLPHHQAHYGGALKSLLQIESELESADRSKANANYSPFRELKREEVHAMNSVVLHELYFDGMTAPGSAPGEAVQDVLGKRFGSVDRWVEDFKAAAVSARGWAILALHPVSGKLYNFVSDVHDVGIPVLGVPLVVADCYEHAFYVDYKNKKGEYVSAYPKYIDWAEIDRRVKSVK